MAEKIHIHARGADGVPHRFDAAEGMTLLDLSRTQDIGLQGKCCGALRCGTCHVVVDPAWAARLPPASEEELDVLDCLPVVAATSRLGCQVRLTAALVGLVVDVPGWKPKHAGTADGGVVITTPAAEPAGLPSAAVVG